MKKLVYMKQDATFINIVVNGYCGFCGLQKDCVASSPVNPVSICKDCSKQVTRLITSHGPPPGQMSQNAQASDEVPF